MTNSSEHNIQRVFVEVDVGSTKMAYALKDQLEDFLAEKVFPIIEKHLAALHGKNGKHIKIDSLRIDLNTDESFEVTVISKQIEEQIRKNLESMEATLAAQDKSGTSTASNEAASTVLHFLEFGQFPWWVSTPKAANVQLDALLYESLEDTNFISSLRNLLKNEVVRKRMARQIPETFLALMVSKVSEPANSFSFLKDSEVVKAIASLPKNVRIHLWEFVLSNAIGASEENLVSILKKNPEEVQLLTFEQTQLFEALGDTIGSLDTTMLFNLDAGTTDSSFPETEIEFSMYGPGADGIEIIFEEDVDSSPDETRLTPTSEAIRDPETSSEAELEGETNTEKTANTTERGLAQVTDKERASHTTANNVELPADNAELFGEHTRVRLETGKSYYIEHAGLVLLHPFLKPFLTNCGLLEHGQINNIDTAVHLLHFLATGAEQQYEHLQITEKFLCGIPPEFPIDRNIILTSELKEKSEELLTAVMGHLPQLKSTAIELLRNEFLQRPGKLILEEENPKIIVERRTQDILLDNLAWNLGLVKLPWHEHLIFVDW